MLINQSLITQCSAEGVECNCPYGYELSDDEKSCQDINECEIYDNDDEEGGSEGEDEPDEDNSPRATFCSHTCTNLIGLLDLNIYFLTVFI